LAVRGRYLHATARPDRWVSWRFDAVRRGLKLIERLRPAVIWTTYPIATAHLIGAELQRRTGLPWVADFRDPMAQSGYPADRRTHEQFLAIEREVFARAAACTFTTPSAAETYRRRYPRSPARIVVVENGYDEASFKDANVRPRGPDAPLVLLHSGIVYPEERDPSALFQALALVREREPLRSGRLRVRFRAPVYGDLLMTLAARAGVADMVEIELPLGYRAALEEMMGADGLLLLQAANCNEQIPAKLYEYLRARRPIFALTDAAGDTARTLAAAGVHTRAPLDDAPAIAELIGNWLRGAVTGLLPTADAVAGASREARNALLCGLFDEVAAASLPHRNAA
jgi:glycosyltransferase involved in cell wall biosynthesis